MDHEIVLKVNDQEIPLNPFVQKMFVNVIEAMVGSLDKLPEVVTEIELKINKEE